MASIVYLPALDLAFEAQTTRPALFHRLVELPGAVADPVRREGGYRLASSEAEDMLWALVTAPRVEGY